jgi:hypothetical protein
VHCSTDSVHCSLFCSGRKACDRKQHQHAEHCGCCD